MAQSDRAPLPGMCRGNDRDSNISVLQISAVANAVCDYGNPTAGPWKVLSVLSFAMVIDTVVYLESC